jgi:nitrite reductase (NADH) small subunit
MTEVGNIEEIPVGEGRTYAVGSEQVAIFRLRDGSVRALRATCPHRGGPLADGLIDHRVVVCPLHGFTYDLLTGQEIANGGPPVAAYTALLDIDGTVHVSPLSPCSRHGVSEADPNRGTV